MEPEQTGDREKMPDVRPSPPPRQKSSKFTPPTVKRTTSPSTPPDTKSQHSIITISTTSVPSATSSTTPLIRPTSFPSPLQRPTSLGCRTPPTFTVGGSPMSPHENPKAYHMSMPSLPNASPGVQLYNISPSTYSLPMPPPFDYPTYNKDKRKSAPTELEENPDGSLTPMGLSWRRMHLGRAKLKATASTSELLSGFAMVAMVELQINEPTYVPEWLFVLFAVCTTVLVSVHIFALMISTYIFPNIDAICKLHLTELVEESPHEKLRWYIELAWAFSTILGLFLFLVELGILCWVKFWDYSFTAAWTATAIVVPVCIIFVVFCFHFYHLLVVHKFKVTTSDLETIEEMKKKLDSETTLAMNSNSSNPV